MADKYRGIAPALVNGDIVINESADGVKDIRLATGLEEVAQAIRVRLRSRVGEDVITPSHGLPIDQLVGVVTNAFIRGAITRSLLLEPRVDSITGIRIARVPDTRQANVILSLRLTDGSELTVAETFGL